MAKILLIDDDPVLLKLYTTRLEADKHDVKNCNNGEDALSVLKEFRPELVVVDLMMPKLNGFQFVEAVKNNPDTKNIPVLIFSSMANPQSLELKSKGVAGVLNKVDITPTQLVETINTLLKKAP